MRDDYLQAARAVISDPYVLINAVSRRVKQLRRGARPLVESLEKLKAEDIALREIAEGKISYELHVASTAEETDLPRQRARPMPVSGVPRPEMPRPTPALAADSE